jgi:hypothetical protein
MLGGHCAAVLPEWLAEVARLSRHTPSELLPALLERARQDRRLRPLVLAAGGERAHWLARHNPDWNFASTEAGDVWETGTREQRVAILRELRVANPSKRVRGSRPSGMLNPRISAPLFSRSWR